MSRRPLAPPVKRWQALAVEASLRDASPPVRGGPLASRRAGPLEDELDVAGVLTPLVEGHHGVLVRRQVAFGLAPFLDQSVPAGYRAMTTSWHVVNSVTPHTMRWTPSTQTFSSMAFIQRPSFLHTTRGC
ncbi:hypothetical protein EYF80_061664 [Liparis tanakae]|uniref:Uncharacterized protein n=1 Tax=Liparis tanakae TaxID=230148 RepID=A0A4Z2EH37_9TELE|nr:hypothetical protein EYF80_061664 [Liparis tanakae]